MSVASADSVFDSKPKLEALGRVLAIAFAWRLLMSFFTAVPTRDGVNYLWMAERLAEGRAHLALSEVFPPGLPLLLAPFVWLPLDSVGLDAFRTAQVVQAVIGVASIVVIMRLTESYFGCGASCAGCMLMFATRHVQLGAEVSTEPLFALLAGLAALDALRDRYLRSGLWSGLAFWVRPEGPILALAVFLTRFRRGGVLALVPALAAFCALGVLRWWVDLPFWPEAKWALHEARLFPDGASFVARLTHYVGNLVFLPVRWLEAFGIPGLLAVYAVLPGRREAELQSRALVYTAFGGAFAAIASFFARWRFLLGWLPFFAVLAVAGLRRLPRSGHWPLMFLIMFSGIIMSLRSVLVQADRYGERLVATWVGEKLEPGETLVTDLTRVMYFAGRRPLTPRPFSVDEVVEKIRSPNVRFVVLDGLGAADRVERNRTRRIRESLGEEWERLSFPPKLERHVKNRHLGVWRRRVPDETPRQAR